MTHDNSNLPAGVTQDHPEFSGDDLGTKECPFCIDGYHEEGGVRIPCNTCNGTHEVPRTEEDVLNEREARAEQHADL